MMYTTTYRRHGTTKPHVSCAVPWPLRPGYKRIFAYVTTLETKQYEVSLFDWAINQLGTSSNKCFQTQRQALDYALNLSEMLDPDY